MLLVTHRHDGEILCEVGVSDGLGLDALRRVDDQKRALARRERARDLSTREGTITADQQTRRWAMVEGGCEPPRGAIRALPRIGSRHVPAYR